MSSTFDVKIPTKCYLGKCSKITKQTTEIFRSATSIVSAIERFVDAVVTQVGLGRLALLCGEAVFRARQDNGNRTTAGTEPHEAVRLVVLRGIISVSEEN